MKKNVDCWSYGIILFEIILGTHPFRIVETPDYHIIYPDILLTFDNQEWEKSDRGALGLYNCLEFLQLDENY